MTVDEHLNTVDYSHPNYVPSTSAAKFINFVKLVNQDKGGEENKSPVVHMKMLDSMFTQNKRTAIMCHRGIAKTTLFAEYMFLYIAVFGKLDGFGSVELALYVSDSIENGVKNLRKNIEYRYDSSEFLKSHIKIKFTDVRLEFTNNNGKKLIVKMYGAKTGVRGAKELGKRPQLAILDDLVSDDDARSPTVINSIEDTVHKAVKQALHPTRSKTVWLGTPFNESDPLYKAVESGAWEVSVFPVAEEFDITTTEDTFVSSWSDRFTWDYVKDAYDSADKQGKLDGFYQELMLRIVSDEERMVKDDDLVKYQFVDIKDKLDTLNTYITTDFATSEKKASDPSAISVWGVTNNNDKLWLDGINSRQLMNKNIDKLFELVQIYNPMAVGIETSGQQGGFIDWIKGEMLRRNIYFNIVEVRPTKSKLERFIKFQPEIKMKKIWYPTDHRKEIVDQHKSQFRSITLKGIKSKHDDCIDTVTMLSEMPIIVPSSEMEVRYNANLERMELYNDNIEQSNSYIIN